MVRRWFYGFSVLLLTVLGLLSLLWPPAAWSLLVIGPPIALGVHDSLQRRHTILRNFPLIGHLRYLMEMMRPEIQQYFIESNINAHPIERELRNVVYQRAKGDLETTPYGTQHDVYRIGYEWASHSLAARPPLEEAPRVNIGGPDCRQPYSASLLNISAMSFGALSSSAVRALNRGAKLGNFAHNTGEGGISRYHLEAGGDLIWQIGTGYFGCRDKNGCFDAEQFRDKANGDSVRMIEIKLSQGAKPGHGGVLPGVKVNQEIADARQVEVGKTVFSPPAHSAFSTPLEMMEFIVRLREMTDGKPIGFKLCIGRRDEFFAICKAMMESEITPDFITVDGGEGGTGAAPLEFSNSLGMPARDAWIFVHSTLQGIGLRDRISLIASGKILAGFDMIRAFALGADVCFSARGMMLALGCIQSLRCNTNHCPTGVTTQKPSLVYGLDVSDKSQRVARFHRRTLHAFLELLGAMGLNHPSLITPRDIYRRIDDKRVSSLADLYDVLQTGQLLSADGIPEDLRADWHAVKAERWPLHADTG